MEKNMLIDNVPVMSQGQITLPDQKLDNTPRHNDPFDKLLIAQAKTENLIFLTHDKNLIFYNEPCVYLE